MAEAGETREIALTQGKVALVDADLFDWLSQWNWFAYKAPGKHVWYAGRQRRRRRVLMHRAILQVFDDVSVDHANGDGLDNRRANLREASRAQNCANARMRRDGGVLYKGIYKKKGAAERPYVAQIGGTGEPGRHIGAFRTAEEAARAYDSAAIAKYGAFARINFPDQERAA